MADLSRKRLEARLRANGHSNPAAAVRDLWLFGNFEKAGKLNWYLGIEVWELEEAVALTLGKDPRDISEAEIREKCPEDIANRKLARVRPQALPSLTQLFMERCERLKRAAIAGSLHSEERGGKIWFKPHDFLLWYDTKSGWKDDYLPGAMDAILAEWRGNSKRAKEDTEKEKPCVASRVVADSDSADNADAGKGKVDFSSLGVSEDQRGVAETWELLVSEMSKLLNKRKHPTAKKCREHCQDTLHIRYHDFVKLISKANTTPGLEPWPKGRPRSTK